MRDVIKDHYGTAAGRVRKGKEMAELNIIIGTHGHFGEELVKSAELITGKMEGVQVVSLLPTMSFEDFMKQADEVLSTTKKPYIVLVDLFGGTPCNVFTVLSRKYNYDVVSGVNLPMLVDLYVKTLNMEDADIHTDELAEECIAALKESGVHTNKQLD